MITVDMPEIAMTVNRKFVKNVPSVQGVYVISNSQDEVIYVGKSIDLNQRLTTHISGGSHIENMYKEFHSVDIYICEKDYETEMLETYLINDKKPKYNTSKVYFTIETPTEKNQTTSINLLNFLKEDSNKSKINIITNKSPNKRFIEYKKREAEILYSFKKLDFLTTSQIQRLHNLGTLRNAQRVMNSIIDYLNCFRLDQNVYYLNQKGREFVESDRSLSKNLQVPHMLIKNEIYLYFNNPDKWYSNKQIYIGEKKEIRPNVLFQDSENLFNFIEIELTQKMTKIKEKIKKYSMLKESELFQNEIGYFPKIFWYTVSNKKAKDIVVECNKYGLDISIIMDVDM